MSEEELEQEQEQQQEVESRATRMGWVPLEKFKGDPDKWIDADAYVKRAETELPIAQGTIKILERKLDKALSRIEEQSKTFEQFNKYHKSSLQQEYERGLAEAQAEMRRAVEEADLEAFDAAQAKADKLIKEGPGKEAGEEDAAPKVDPEINREWVEENPWFLKEFKMHKYAKECGDFLAMTQPQLTQKQQLAEIGRMVKEEFPDYFGNPNRKKAAAVESGDQTASPGGNSRGKQTYHNLPPEAKKMCDDFCREIPNFTREQYLKTYSGPWV